MTHVEFPYGKEKLSYAPDIHLLSDRLLEEESTHTVKKPSQAKEIAHEKSPLY